MAQFKAQGLRLAPRMNLFRWIYPLRLRQSLFARVSSKLPPLPDTPSGGFPLVFGHFSVNELHPTDHGHRFLAWCGFYDLRLSRTLAGLASVGGVLVDVGANIGYFSLLWTAYNRKNTALAFEASPRNQTILRANIAANRLCQRVDIYPFALGKSESIAAFDPGPAEQSGWGGLSLSASDRTIQIRVSPLDAFIPADKPISVLKVDTEGADLWVLMGAQNLLRRKQIQNIFYESNVERMQLLGIEPDEPTTFLNRFNYKITQFDDQQFHAAPN
jgi:FkbM family methyltransferase